MYDQITSLVSMSSVLDNVLREYNKINTTLDLDFLKDDMKHVARIVRIINEGGHVLLVGVGGSGKQN